ncbi:MAG: RNA polymerase sigma factor [Acidimicrobiia bacterium]
MSGVGVLGDRRDRRLVERIGIGDEDAFAELFGRYGPAVLGLALRVIGDQTLAEEVVQEVFVSVWRRAGAYDPQRGGVRSWLLTQAHHRAVDVVRREASLRRRTAAVVPDAVASDDPTDIVEEGEVARRRIQVRTALGALPEGQRTVLELAYFGGLSQTQVAERVGIPVGTVKSRTLAAMRRLRALLERGEEDG